MAARLARPDALLPRRPLGPPPLVLRLAAVLAVPLLLYALVATGQKALENYRVNQQAEALRAEVRALRDENLRLQQEMVEARTDATIERIARTELGLVQPGDHAVVLAASEKRPAAEPTRPQPPQAQPPAWRQWWELFFGTWPRG